MVVHGNFLLGVQDGYVRGGFAQTFANGVFTANANDMGIVEFRQKRQYTQARFLGSIVTAHHVYRYSHRQVWFTD
jgi:hypothetical protein